ncbi:MAG TPA: hypothetical protein VFA39_00185 [Steroidobacteraceae bacterium]|nr:hypothetical protein [Steroidobacteraceae bacterium]
MSQNGLPSLLDRHWAESALAVGAVVIAAASLWVAFDAERTNRELVASQSWPYVEVYESDTPSEPRAMSLIVTNDGIGPAKLESFELFWKGKPQHSPWELLASCCTQAQQGSSQPVDLATLRRNPDLQTSTDEGVVLRAGESVPILSLTRGAGSIAIWDTLHSTLRGNVSLRYCYCSAFDQCWLTTQQFGHTRNMNPPEVRVCPHPKVPYDNIGG